MIPSAFVLLDALPLTPNGKVDRHKLPALDIVNLQPAKSLVAPRDTTELELSHLWEEMLQIRPIGVHDNFFELGGHSLLAVRLMAQIQQQFKKQLPLATVFRCPTVGQMAIVLRQDGNPLPSSPLVPIQPNGAKRAFFCVPGAGGMAFVFYPLTHHLGTDRPIYALQPQGLDGRSTPLARTQELAAFYIHAIRSVQPKGPYLLGGHSYGAWVAYEMAHQLLGQGQAVELLAVFDMPACVGRDDSMAVGKEDDKWLDTILAMMQALSGARIEISPKMLGELDPDDQLNHLRNEFIRTNLLSPETPLNQVRGIMQVLKADLAATGHYRLTGGYPRPITLLRTDHIDKQVFGPMRDIQDDPTWGWQRLSTAPVNVHIVPGDHSTMLAKPHVQVLAEQFRGCLDRTEMESVDAE